MCLSHLYSNLLFDAHIFIKLRTNKLILVGCSKMEYTKRNKTTSTYRRMMARQQRSLITQREAIKPQFWVSQHLGVLMALFFQQNTHSSPWKRCVSQRMPPTVLATLWATNELSTHPRQENYFIARLYCIIWAYGQNLPTDTGDTHSDEEWQQLVDEVYLEFPKDATRAANIFGHAFGIFEKSQNLPYTGAPVATNNGKLERGQFANKQTLLDISIDYILLEQAHNQLYESPIGNNGFYGTIDLQEKPKQLEKNRVQKLAAATVPC